MQRQAIVQACSQAPEAPVQWRQMQTTSSITSKVLVVKEPGDARSPTGSVHEAHSGRFPEPSPERQEGFRKRGGEGRSSGGGPTTLNFSTSSSSKVQARPKAPAARERGSTASASRNSPRGQGPGPAVGGPAGPGGPGSRPRGRTSSSSGICVSPRRRENQKVMAQAQDQPAVVQAKAAKEAPKPCFSPAWPADIFAREEANPCARSPRGDGRGRDAWNRAESPHDCIASARSRSPEMDGVMRRSGAGRSSGGGPSSICLGDTPTKAPALRIPQRAFSDGPIQPPREPGCKEKERSWRRQSDLSVKSLSTYCPEDTPCVAVSATDAGEDRGLAYDDLFAENRLLRAENAQLRSELEKYQAWYEQLTASYYNGNGYLKK